MRSLVVFEKTPSQGQCAVRVIRIAPNVGWDGALPFSQPLASDQWFGLFARRYSELKFHIPRAIPGLYAPATAALRTAYPFSDPICRLMGRRHGVILLMSVFPYRLAIKRTIGSRVVEFS